jgi:hypothetical protein
MKNTIEQVELQAAQELDAPIKNFLRNHYPEPKGRRVTVSLFDASGRKKRRSASTDNWSPEAGEIRIRFEPAPSAPLQRTGTGTDPGGDNNGSIPGTQSQGFPRSDSGPNVFVHPAEADLLKALDRAESIPGWKFVPLKKFRDEILPSDQITSKYSDAENHAMLRSAIEKRFVLKGQVPNPKSPQFPVTTIRLNRLMPEVKRVVGHGDDADLEFHPIEIKGEPLSATIIRERHR